MKGSGPWLARFGVVSLAGGLLGAKLFLSTRPGVFDALVPYLILLASLLFMAQEPISRWLRSRRTASAPDRLMALSGHQVIRSGTRGAGDPHHLPLGLLFQF